MIRFFLPLLIVLGLSACNMPTDPSANPQSEQQVQHVELVYQFFKHFNNHEWEKLAAMYSEPADFRDPSLGLGIMPQTRAQTIAKYSELNAIFPDLHDAVTQIYPSGEEHVIVEFTSTGTEPDGVKFELPICAILSFEKGKITKDFTYYDNFEEGGE